MPHELEELKHRDWQRERFTPRDSIRFDARGREEIVPGGWDHEHCLICHATISDRGDDERFGYSDEEDRWLCESCYRAYILGKPDASRRIA